jgi:hypothetical protein
MNREGDAAACPANAFRMLINTRTEDSEIHSRGGQTALNPNEPMDGCVTGIWPPEFEPPDQTFTRLLITPGYVYAPAETVDVRDIGTDPNGIFLYWSGERLLATQLGQGDGQEGWLLEYRLTKESGLTVLDSSDPDYSRISFHYTTGTTSTVGAPVLHAGKYYCPVLDNGDMDLMEIEYGTTDWEDTDVNAGGWTSQVPVRWATKTPDGRVIWFQDDDNGTNATLGVRDSEGAFTVLNFPVGFDPIQYGTPPDSGNVVNSGLTAWAWFNAKLYIGGDDGTGLGIVAFDPVTSTFSAPHSVNLSIPDICSMAVHKGILYFSYETTGGAHRIGTLRAGTWTDSVYSNANPDPIIHMCSFQGYLYVTKGELLLRDTNPHDNNALAVFYTAEEDLGVMVAVP